MSTAVVLLSLLSSGITIGIILVGLVEERVWLARWLSAVSTWREFDSPAPIHEVRIRHPSRQNEHVDSGKGGDRAHRLGDRDVGEPTRDRVIGE